MCPACDPARPRRWIAAVIAIALAGSACGSNAASGSDEPPRPAAVDASVLRVCADPNNLPFSNDRREGLENELADLVAAALGRRVEYTWWPQRRGFFRTTLRAGVCDVVMGVPEDFEMALTTRPYYRSTYAFVTRRDRALRLVSMDDPRLRELRIGIHLIGDDYASVPPGDALISRGIVRNVKGYSIYGDYSKPNPPADLIEGVARGDVDVAVAWGPLAGYFAARSVPPLEVHPVASAGRVPFEFSIAVGVRPDARVLRDRLDDVLVRKGGEIERLLERFHVPRVAVPDAARVQARR